MTRRWDVNHHKIMRIAAFIDALEPLFYRVAFLLLNAFFDDPAMLAFIFI